jgi:hypothetical protein
LKGGSIKSRQITPKAETNVANKPQKQQSSNTISLNAEDHVFRYDFENNDQANSENASTATYSNLSSPLNKDNPNSVPIIVVPPPPPPLVYRELKPGRKMSDSNVSSESSPTVINKDANCIEQVHIEPPSINRKLKPSLVKPPVEGTRNENLYFTSLKTY